MSYTVVPTPGGGGNNSPPIPLSPDTLEITKGPAGELTADLGRGPRPQDCGGSQDGTVGTYSLTAELSGPCKLKVMESSNYVVCFEPYFERRVLELDASQDQTVGTASNTQGCMCEPPRSSTYSVQATRN